MNVSDWHDTLTPQNIQVLYFLSCLLFYFLIFVNREGGVRVPAFVTGGFVENSQRGTRRNGMMHTADWMATLAGLAGVDPVGF